MHLPLIPLVAALLLSITPLHALETTPTSSQTIPTALLSALTNDPLNFGSLSSLISIQCNSTYPDPEVDWSNNIALNNTATAFCTENNGRALAPNVPVEQTVLLSQEQEVLNQVTYGMTWGGSDAFKVNSDACVGVRNPVVHSLQHQRV
jgi:hypothetical protein